MAVYFGVSLVALIASLAMAIDIGRLYNAQRSLQRAANVAALDAARVANGCLGNVADSAAQSVAQTEAAASLVRNNVPAGYLASNGVLLGRLARNNGIRYFEPIGSADASTRTAVQVRLQRPSPQRILPLTAGPIMTATAAADSRPIVTFGLGSGLASLSGGIANTLLNGLIGGSGVSLTAVSYQGLANTNIRIGDLVAQAGAATLDDFLTANTSLPAVFNDILNSVGDGDCGAAGCGAVRAALTQLAAAANSGRSVTPGSVLDAPLGLGASGEDALVNVGELVMALSQSANGSNAINLPLIASVPALGTGVNAQIRIVEPAKLAVARAGDHDTYATTSQAQVDITITATNINIGVPGLASVRVTLAVPLSVRAGEATAQLDEVHCARRGQPQHRVSLDTTTSALEAGIGTFTKPIGAPGGSVTPVNIGTVSARVLFIQQNIATLSAGVYADVGSDQDGLQFQGPFPSAVQSVSTELGQALSGLTSDLVTSLGQPNGLKVTALGIIPINAGLIAAPVLNLLAPVLGQVGTALEPVLALLGVNVGTADVQVVSLIPENNPDIPPGAEADGTPSLQAFLFTH